MCTLAENICGQARFQNETSMKKRKKPTKLSSYEHLAHDYSQSVNATCYKALIRKPIVIRSEAVNRTCTFHISMALVSAENTRARHFLAGLTALSHCFDRLQLAPDQLLTGFGRIHDETSNLHNLTMHNRINIIIKSIINSLWSTSSNHQQSPMSNDQDTQAQHFGAVPELSTVRRRHSLAELTSRSSVHLRKQVLVARVEAHRFYWPLLPASPA